MVRGALERPSDIKGIVSESGSVKKIPVLLESQRKILVDIDVCQMQHIITNNVPYLDTSLKNAPMLVKHILQKHYKNFSEEFMRHRTQLRYCTRCFATQIEEFGHPFFSIEWLYNTRCSIHNIKLHHIRQIAHSCCGISANIIDNVRSSFTGICVKCASYNWQYSEEVIINARNKSQYFVFRKPEIKIL